MKPPPFDYLAPLAAGEIVDLLASTDREVKVLAGGQSLLPVLNLRMAHPDLLVDISRVEELRTVEVGDDGSLTVGAAVTQSEVAAHPAVAGQWPLVAAAIEQIGHPQIRNRGTLCGSLAHADPAAELPCVAVVLDAELVVDGPDGSRRVPAADFFLGTFTTALDHGELLVRAEFPAPAPGAGWALHEFAQRRGDFATAGVAVHLARDAAGVAEARIGLFGVGPGPVRAGTAEDLLRGQPVTPDLARAAAEAAAAEIDPPADIHASAEFRRELVTNLTTSALLEAWERSA